jgi:hypothetical protein
MKEQSKVGALPIAVQISWKSVTSEPVMVGFVVDDATPCAMNVVVVGKVRSAPPPPVILMRRIWPNFAVNVLDELLNVMTFVPLPANVIV